MKDLFARLWPHLRAALVLFHLTAVVLMAIPAPEGGMDRKQWEEPMVQEEFQTWATMLHVETRPFQDFLWELAVKFMDVRYRVLQPFRKYYEWAGTDQSWRMFVAPARQPTRVRVEVVFPDETRTLYLQNDPNHTWNARIFESYRYRSLLFRYGWPQYGEHMQQFSWWVARQLKPVYPTALKTRVTVERHRTPTPEQEARHQDDPWNVIWIREVNLSEVK